MVERFVGTITKVSEDERSAIVTLDHIVAGKGYAVITPDTKGRIKLMNGKGKLMTDTPVRGTADTGIDALRALEVEKAKG